MNMYIMSAVDIGHTIVDMTAKSLLSRNIREARAVNNVNV
jgi:hypothetical protein